MAQLGGRRRVPGRPGDRARARASRSPDVARNLVAVGRRRSRRATFAQATVDELARHAAIPVINALSDLEHPCQALADFFTLWERGLDLRRLRLAWIGDGNNVCHSLILLAALARHRDGRGARRPGYEPDARRAGDRPGAGAGGSTVTADAREAAARRRRDLHRRLDQHGAGGRAGAAPRGVLSATRSTTACWASPSPGAVVMHCLPAHRGRGDHRRGARRAAERGARPGREPAARAEGRPAPAAGQGLGRELDA